MQITNPDEEFEIRHSEEDSLGKFHYRLQQRYHGIKVWGGEAAVHLAADGSVDSMEGAFISTPMNIPTNAAVSLSNVLESVNQKYFSGRGRVFDESELVINGAVNELPRLAWKFSMSSDLVDARRFLVDAVNGEEVSVVNLVHDGAAAGSGVDSLGYTRSLNLWQNGSTYYLVDTSKAMYVATSTPPALATTIGGITVLDAVNQPPTSSPAAVPSLYYATSSSATSGWVPDAVSAAYGLSKVYDYYYTTHTRNSYDNKGSSLRGVVRYGIGYANAFWSSQYKEMFYGDGMGRSVDVCGHEVTHGVINSIGGAGILEYRNQSGAMNEALADIFGEMVEAKTKGTNDWLMGSDLGSPIRSFINPGIYGQPSRMSQFIYTSSDNGGVHFNSGIINHAYYLLAVGLSGAVGNGDAQRIFYRAMTLHLLWQSQFIDMRHACVTSAEELFGVGSAQAIKTAEAFDAVDIFDVPPTAPPGTIPAVQAPDSTLCLRSGIYGYYLVRKETSMGDPSGGSFVGTVHNLDLKRVSVSGNGSWAVFITQDYDFGVVNTDGTGPSLAGHPGSYSSAAISPDGSRMALVLRDSFTGYAKNQIVIFNLSTSGSQTFTLYGVTSEGNYMDIVDHADVMDFTADGRYLIYDAYCYSVTASGDVLDGWTIFAMDTSTGAIQTLLDLNSDYDIGNPALGNTHGNLIALDVINKATGYSTVVSGNLQNGSFGVVGTTYGMGVPGYTGDDSAVVYSLYDNTVTSLYSIARQGLSADGITTNGVPIWWIRDADCSVIYRRGTYYASNSTPQVSITFPLSGQAFASPTNILIQATASDLDGTVSNVQFYVDSVKIGTDTTAPYTMTWTNASVGSHRLTARAIDNLGAAADSVNLLVYVLLPPKLTAQPQSLTVPAGTNMTFTVTAAGTSPFFYQWWKDGGALLGATNASYSIASVLTNDAGAYSVTVSNAAKSVSSTNAVLTVYVTPFITVQPTNQTVWMGSNVTFSLTASGVPVPKYQWRKNGANLTGATNANFTTNNVTTNSAGIFSCLVSNAYGTVISSNAILTVMVPDTTSPTNTITAPTPGQRWSNALFTVTGTASDNVRVSNVWCQINGLGWNQASTGNGWSNWTALVSLTPGTNTISAYCMDTNGNLSVTNSVSFQYVVTNQLQLSVTGLGTITPSNTWLEIGRNYSITSAPAAGFRFTNWTGSLTATTAALNFMMASNLTFTANFIDTNNPVLSVTNLVAGQRWSNSLFTIRGTASDNWQVASVQVQLNGGNWNTATGTTNWSAALPLMPGTNTVAAYATDNSGNVSATANVSFQYVVTNQLQISMTGLGTISPNYSNAWLEIGRNYSVTSAPAAGFTFTNWTGSFTTYTAALNFTMASNLIFIANFIDTNKPVFSITNLTAGQRLSNAVFTVKGTASDNWQITNVWYQFNGLAWRNATTTNIWTNWYATLNLVPGTNTLAAYATDNSGNVSATTNLNFQFVVTNQLSIRTTGKGTISPNYSNAWLEIGRNYSITSAPTTGFVFTNWTVSTNWIGGATVTGTNLLFMMQSNLTLLATFVETSRPTLTISAPTNNQKMTNALVTGIGTASDNWQISNIWYQLNSNAWNQVSTANSFSNWNTPLLTLISGTNTLKAFALNLGGIYSLTNNVSFVASNTFALQLVFTNAQPMKTNGLVFSLQLSSGLNGRIQFSTNMADWTPLTNFIGTNSTITFRDPGATNSSQRFYRAVIP